MMLNALFTLSSFILTAGSVTTLLSLKARYVVTLISFFTLLISYLILSFNGKRPLILSWIKSDSISSRTLILSFLFLFFSCLFFTFIPETGVTVTHISPNKKETSVRLHVDKLEILPVHYPKEFPPNHSEGALFYSFTFFSPKSIPSLLFFASHGNADWQLDGRSIANIMEEDNSRFSLIVRDIQTGFHSIHCRISDYSPLPQISVRTGTEKPLFGPFFSKQIPENIFFVSHSKDASILSFILFLFFFIPCLNRSLRYLAFFTSRFHFISIFILLVVAIVCFISIRIQFSINTDRLFEADEAAFGLMSQHLLNGQSPPLFHYGQNYQGTLESYPLSFSLLFSNNPISGLHFLPFLWGALFICISSLTFWLFGSRGLALFSFFALSIGGLHFHWIVSKTWFGYSFSLFAGSILWFLSFSAYRKKRVSPGLAFLWGAVSGICLYELPIVFPFIFSSGIILIKLFFDDLFLRFDRSNLLQSLKKELFISFLRSGAFLSLFAFFIATFPYWSGMIFEGDSGAARFMVEGRQLAPARVANENPLIDRFFCECIPVLFGIRPPYDNQYNLPSTIFPDFPSIFFLFSLLLFPLIAKKVFPINSSLQSKTVRISLLSFYINTIFLVSFSPFGVWPWYAIPLFWIVPILFYSLLIFLWNHSPALSFSCTILLLISILSSFTNYNYLFHQPSSLSNQGFSIPTDFEDILSFLDENNFRFLLCDQGFDFSETNVGRDWIGETLMFTGNGSISSVDRLSRRLPDSANEIIQSSRVCYLFHKDYFYRQPGKEKSSSLSLKNFDSLFGPEFLNYERCSFDPYVLFFPSSTNRGFDKSVWISSSSNPIFLLSSYDQNVSPRGSGRETFWSSDSISESGSFYKMSFPTPKTIQTIVLFHGTKTSDRTQENSVFLTLDDGHSYNAGSLSYIEEIRSSVLNLKAPVSVREIKINASKPNDNRWWTIFEFWAF